MDASVRNDTIVNGQSPSQMVLNCLIKHGSQLDEENINQLDQPSPSKAEFGQKTNEVKTLIKSQVKFINQSSDRVSHPDDNNDNKPVRALFSFDCHQETVSSFTSLKELKSEDTTMSTDTVQVFTEISEHCETLVDNAKKKLQYQHFEVRYLESELDNNYSQSNEKVNSCVSSQEFNSCEDSQLLENMLIGLHNNSQQLDKHMENNVLELQSLDVEEKFVSDEKKSQKVKASDSFRPFARLLYDLGQELVRQLVYQDLIEIQMAKEAKNELDEKGKHQLMKLTEAHVKLCTKNDAYKMPVWSCRCGFMSSFDNVIALHCEYGHSNNQFPHVCCYCYNFGSKWPSQFVSHMETVHAVKARVQKKLALNNCFFCPYEHKNWMKIEMHMSKCGNKFSLSSNLQPQPADCDIPVLYKPGQSPRIYPCNQFTVSNMGGLYPPPVATPTTSLGVSAGQSSVMEIDGQLYSLVNHNGKMLLTSLRSQIGGSTSTGRITSSSAKRGKVLFSSTRPSPSSHDPIKSSVPVHRETCEICGSVINDREALWNHFRDVHRVELSITSLREQEPWMKCTLCNTRFWTYQGLARHSSSHHNRNIVPLPQTIGTSRSTRCYLCGNSQASNSLSHFSTFHNITLLDMYQNCHCCMCNKRLRQSRAFEEHMIMQHRDIFANFEVLHTVIQALSTAYYLKGEDGILQRQPLIAQQLQQNASGLGTIANAKLAFGSKLVSSSSGIDLMHSMRTTSSTNTDSGLKISRETNFTTEIGISSGDGDFPGPKALSNAIMTSGKKSTCGAAELRIGSSLKTALLLGAMCGDKIHNSNVQSSGGTTKVTTLPVPNISKLGRPAIVSKSRTKRNMVKATEQAESSLLYTKAQRKTREEDDKDLNRLYRELSDIGRPILRSMRYRFTQNEDSCNMLKRPAESTKNLNLDAGAKVKFNVGRPAGEQKPDGPVNKKPCLDLEKMREAQENFQSEVPEVIINNLVTQVSNS